MSFNLSKDEIFETVRMVQAENLDIRTITMGINILDCRGGNGEETGRKVRDKIVNYAHNLVEVGEDIEKEYGIPIINKRIAVTPAAMIADGLSINDTITVARYLDRAAQEVGVNFLGGFSAWCIRDLRGEIGQ